MANTSRATTMQKGGSKQTTTRGKGKARRLGMEGRKRPTRGGRNRPDRVGRSVQASNKAGSGQGSRKN